jgi:hypothetical protein
LRPVAPLDLVLPIKVNVHTLSLDHEIRKGWQFKTLTVPEKRELVRYGHDGTSGQRTTRGLPDYRYQAKSVHYYPNTVRDLPVVKARRFYWRISILLMVLGLCPISDVRQNSCEMQNGFTDL